MELASHGDLHALKGDDGGDVGTLGKAGKESLLGKVTALVNDLFAQSAVGRMAFCSDEGKPEPGRIEAKEILEGADMIGFRLLLEEGDVGLVATVMMPRLSQKIVMSGT